MSGGVASAGGLAPAVHAPPPLSMRDLTRGEAPRAPSFAFCIVQGSVLPFGDAPCVCFNGRENRGRGPPFSAAHAASPAASLRSRSSEGASNGQRVEEAWL